MKATVARAAGATRTVVRAVRSEQVTFLAASLAYYGFVSLLPLLLLALVAAAVVGQGRVAARVAAEVAASFGQGAGDLVLDALSNAGGQAGATVVGAVVLLWSALKVFRGLDIAFSQVYGGDPAAGLLDQVRDAAVGLLAVGAAVAAVVGLSVLAAVSGIRFAGVLATPALAVAITLALLPLYVLFPDERVSVRHALPGAAFAAVGWTALATLFRVYAARAGTYEAYGVIGGVLLLVTWLYFGGVVLLVGAVLNAVLAGEMDEDEVPRRLPDPDHTRTETSLMGETPDIDIDDIDDESDLQALREELREFEERVDERTVHRDEIEGELKAYVRDRMRSGHARGWGPYLVLLYGTAMTLGAFFLLSGGWAVLAMVVVWLSTLGLYALMVLVGTAVGATSLPGRLLDKARSLRD